jgi:phenylpropionate dioxygenase-like ring-hydroxylating dioxygenase large terminal subunit
MAKNTANGSYPTRQVYPFNQWYIAAFSHEVTAKPIARTILDSPVAIVRLGSGKPIALYDRCAHRGMPLSMGVLRGETLQCGYHGIEYDASGTCVKIPQQEARPAAMCVRSFPLVEKWQWLWIWMGDPALADESLIPDHDWLGVQREGYHARPFFHMWMGANYQFMHDNLLDTSHVTYLHPGLLDTGEMASSTFWTKDEGRILRLGRDTPNLRFPESIANYFKVKADYPYDRTLVVEAFLPSLNVGKQSIRDPSKPDAPPQELYAINCLTPETARSTHVFHAQVTSFKMEWTPELIGGVEFIVSQDKVAIEAIQKRYDQFGDDTEVSLASDQMGVKSRRLIAKMAQTEAPHSESQRASVNA